MKLNVTVNAVRYEVDVEVAAPSATLPVITIAGGTGPVVAAAAPAAAKPAAPAAPANAIIAPLAGTVNSIEVEVGQAIEEGDIVISLEAMKMLTEITAPRAGSVKAILVAKGDSVQGGQNLIELA